MIKKFTYFTENVEVKDLQGSLKSMIENSLKTTDSKTVEEFIRAYKEDPESTQIQGLINNVDIYDFYMKYQDDIDELLNSSDFYSKTPKEMNVYSLYNYTIIGTKNAIKLALDNFENKEEVKDVNVSEVPKF
jgi:hypothetical protein